LFHHRLEQIILGAEKVTPGLKRKMATYLEACGARDVFISGTYGFTGADPAARLAKQGLVGGSAEVVTSALDPVEAVDMNAHSVYHRLAILHPRARYAGFAAESRAVIDLFWEQEDLAEVEFAVYPGHGQLEVPPRFHRVEVPDPLPDHGYPVGPPLHVWAPGVQLEEATLSGPGLTGELITLHRGNAPMGGALADSVFLVPPAPLLPGQAYQAELRFRSGRKSWTRRFGFGVGRLAPGEVEVRLGQLRWEALGRRVTVTADASSSRPGAPHLRWSVGDQVLQEGPATELEWEAPRGTSTLTVLAYDPTYSDAYARAELTLTTR